MIQLIEGLRARFPRCSASSWLLVAIAVCSGMSAVAWAQGSQQAPAVSLDSWTGIVAILTGGGVSGSIAMKVLRAVDRLISQLGRLLTLLEEIWQTYTAGKLRLPRVVVQVQADEEVRAIARMVMNRPDVELEPDDGPPTQPGTGRSQR